MPDLPIDRIVSERLGWHLDSEPLLVVEYEAGVFAFDREDLRWRSGRGEDWATAYLARLDRMVEAYLQERGV